jgi:hypothetical protein
MWLAGTFEQKSHQLSAFSSQHLALSIWPFRAVALILKAKCQVLTAFW